MNQFLYDDFCNSVNFTHISKELSKLNKYISNKENILLYSKRKFGKTSLIKEFFTTTIDKEQYITIYIDLFNVVSAIDFIKVFYQQIATSIPYENNKILKVLKTLFHKVNFTAIMQDDGALKFDISLLTYNPEELIVDIYKGLNKLYFDTSKHIVIAFDDFWQIKLIKNIKMDLLLTQYIENEQYISYIFTGSKYRLLMDMFTKKRSPLVNLATHFELVAIPLDEFYEFIHQKVKYKIDYEIFKHIYTITDGEAKLIQEFCYHLFNKIGHIEHITLSDIEEICLFLLKSKSEYFKMIFNRLSPTQKIALKAIVMGNGVELYTKNNLFKLQVTKATLNTAIKYLYVDELIDKQDGRYYISNKCFEMWCKKSL